MYKLTNVAIAAAILYGVVYGLYGNEQAEAIRHWDLYLKSDFRWDVLGIPKTQKEIAYIQLVNQRRAQAAHAAQHAQQQQPQQQPG